MIVAQTPSVKHDLDGARLRTRCSLGAIGENFEMSFAEIQEDAKALYTVTSYFERWKRFSADFWWEPQRSVTHPSVMLILDMMG